MTSPTWTASQSCADGEPRRGRTPRGARSGRAAGSARLASTGDERWLSMVWEGQSFERRGLQTTSGLRFKVVFPGLRPGGAGPDFRDAILALADGSLLRGDVELHLQSSGWRDHGHHTDPAYDRVLLHVVLEDDEPAVNSAGERPLTLELAGRLGPVRTRGRARQPRERGPAAPASDPPGERRPVTVLYEHGPGLGAAHRGANSLAELPDGGAPTAQLSYVVAPCKRILPRAGTEMLRPVVTGLALERFAAKRSVFEAELAVVEPEQALYTGLMQALGYSRNREPFRHLAQLVPLSATASAGSAERIEELLLAGAGLAFAPASVLIQAGLTGDTLPAAAWTSAGVRPDNLPQRRIAQFAAILARIGRAGLLEALVMPLADGASGGWKLAVRRHLWELGQQRVDAAAINVLLPFAAAYGQATCQFVLAENAAQAFLRYPAEGGNQVTRYMRREILGELAGVAAGAAGEQALLHVWDRWCHDKVCALCPLGARSLLPANE